MPPRLQPSSCNALLRQAIDLRRLYRHAARQCEPGLRVVLNENAHTLDLRLPTCRHSDTPRAARHVGTAVGVASADAIWPGGWYACRPPRQRVGTRTGLSGSRLAQSVRTGDRRRRPRHAGLAGNFHVCVTFTSIWIIWVALHATEGEKMSPAAQEVLAFWFAEANMPRWFDADAAFDEQIRDRFGRLLDAAAEVRSTSGRPPRWAGWPG